MSQRSSAIPARLEPLHSQWLDALMQVEQSAYSHPWTRGNFSDAMQAGYHCQLLLGDQTLLGYYVAMQGVDEAHLLNLTVAPAYQGQGWGRLLLDALALWARSLHAQCIWLEVRASNQAALHLYASYGFCQVGRRKHYYPSAQAQREDAIVMSLLL